MLSPHAVPLQGRLGRATREEDDAFRNPFQRDRDRIMFSRAFLRLQGKTQVFAAGEDDHVRTRLTHTLAVAQVSRNLARALGLNEDLSECIALAHDLGHPPFGHAGESELDAWARERGERFEHNLQSHRIVTVLEQHSSRITGLNLNLEVIDGLLKHSSEHPITGASITLSCEAMLVDLCDQLTYSAHDCDDGLQAGLFSMDELRTVPLIQTAHGRALARGTFIRGAILDVLSTDLLASSTLPTIRLSDHVREQLDHLGEFLSAHLYRSSAVLAQAKQGRTLLRTLCDQFEKDPPQKITEMVQRRDEGLTRAILDYVSGMTEQFARSHTSPYT